MTYEKLIHRDYQAFVRNVIMRDVNALDSNNDSLLICLIQSELLMKVVFLLRIGADPNLRIGYDKVLPLSSAIMIDNPALISVMIAFGALIDEKTSDEDERTPRDLIYLNPYLAVTFDPLLSKIKIRKPVKITQRKPLSTRAFVAFMNRGIKDSAINDVKKNEESGEKIDARFSQSARVI